MFGSRVLCSWAKVYANLSETHSCLHSSQIKVYANLSLNSSEIHGHYDLRQGFSQLFFGDSNKNAKDFEATVGFSTCSANLSSQVVSDATWSAFNGRLAAVSEGQAYFSSVHRVHRTQTSLARTLRQLCQARPELTLFAAEEFCTKALAEVGGVLGGESWEEKLGKNCMQSIAYLQHNLRWENIVDNYVPHHWNPAHTLQTSTI